PQLQAVPLLGRRRLVLLRAARRFARPLHRGIHIADPRVERGQLLRLAVSVAEEPLDLGPRLPPDVAELIDAPAELFRFPLDRRPPRGRRQCALLRGIAPALRLAHLRFGASHGYPQFRLGIAGRLPALLQLHQPLAGVLLGGRRAGRFVDEEAHPRIQPRQSFDRGRGIRPQTGERFLRTLTVLPQTTQVVRVRRRVQVHALHLRFERAPLLFRPRGPRLRFRQCPAQLVPGRRDGVTLGLDLLELAPHSRQRLAARQDSLAPGASDQPDHTARVHYFPTRSGACAG